jgi:hypothetical protein
MSDQNPTEEFETRVRAALQADAEWIQPGLDGLARIRERTAAGTRSRRRVWLVTAAAGLATAAAVAAGVVISGDVLDRSAPPGPAGPSQTPSTREVTVPVYYLGETTTGLRLFREFHRVRTSEPEAVAALNQMFSQPPSDPDYSSPWPAESRALSVERFGGQITVDLSSPVLETNVARGTADLMTQQLVYTVQGALQSTDPVQLLVEGGRVADISGSPTAEPLARADAHDVQALTWVISPAEGATVPSTFRVEGIASAFEGNVVWQLLRGSAVVDEGFTTTAEGQTFSPYSFTVGDVPAGDYTLRVYQTSPEDGSETFVDTKSITVEETSR